MIEILQLHFVLTAFWLSVWIPVDYVLPLYHGVVWFALALVQRIIFVIDNDVRPSATVYWGYSALSTLLGITLGVLFQWCVKPPVLLSRKPGFEARVFVKAPVLTALFVGAQVFYGKLPPQEDSPWGIILTAILTSVVIVVTWAWSYDEPSLHDTTTANADTYSSFLWWIGVNATLVLLFLLGYTSLAEETVALIAGGGTIVLLLVVQLFRPGKLGQMLDYRAWQAQLKGPVY